MNYIIDYTKLTIHNAESNGAKPIEDITLRSLDDPSVNHWHIVYINDDGRYWFQNVTDDEAAKIDYHLHTPDASYTANDYSMGVQI